MFWWLSCSELLCGGLGPVLLQYHLHQAPPAQSFAFRIGLYLIGVFNTVEFVCLCPTRDPPRRISPKNSMTLPRCRGSSTWTSSRGTPVSLQNDCAEVCRTARCSSSRNPFRNCLRNPGFEGEFSRQGFQAATPCPKSCHWWTCSLADLLRK